MEIKILKLTALTDEIDAHPEWWKFPKDGTIEGFMGTGPVFIVGDQPSRSEWPPSHPNRKAFYSALKRLGLENAHLTDLYKKRGQCSELRRALPSDFGYRLAFFKREIELLKPTQIVALGWLV